MKDVKTGWVIVCIGHPRTGNKFIFQESFHQKRSDAIQWFIKDTGKTWDYWKKKCNYRCMKATQTIQVI